MRAGRVWGAGQGPACREERRDGGWAWGGSHGLCAGERRVRIGQGMRPSRGGGAEEGAGMGSEALRGRK